MTVIDTVFSFLSKKVNVRGISMLIALVIAISGSVMIYKGIKDEGAIDIKSPFVSGQLRSGFVGVVLIFLASAICITGLMTRGERPRQKIKLRKGDMELEWDGDLYYWNESRNILDIVDSITQMVLKEGTAISTDANVLHMTANNANSADAQKARG